MIHRPVLPPRLGYVEQEINGQAVYVPVNGPGVAIEQLGIQSVKTESRVDQNEHYLGEMFSAIDFSTSERLLDLLAKLPASTFPEYTLDPNKTYFKGEAVRTSDTDKYMAQNQTTTSLHPSQNPMFKLFRDNGLYEWVREEYCLRGYVRSYEGKWYEVIAARVDSATPPPNDPASWREIEGDPL